MAIYGTELTVAQYVALAGQPAPGDHPIAIVDLGSLIAGLPLEDFLAMGAQGIDFLDASDGSIELDLDKYQAMGSVQFASADLIRILGTAAGDTIGGATVDLTLRGFAGNDTLSGGVAGVVTTMEGGIDDDVYYVNSIDDIVVELADEGVDTVVTTLNSYRLGANVENATFVGTGDFVVTGNELDNVFTGGTGLNTVSYGTATMGVTVDLSIAGPQDTVGAGIDTLVGIQNVYGSLWDDTLTGDDGDNLIIGRAGNDTLWGSAGTDTLRGVDGDDTLYLYGGAGSFNGGAGTDTVISGDLGEYTFAKVEVLEIDASLAASIEQLKSFRTITSTSGDPESPLYIGLFGDGGKIDFSNRVNGNPIAIFDGGLTGAVTIVGAAGDDYLEATDWNDSLAGGDGDDQLGGGDGDDLLQGNAGDDILDGWIGADRMVGGRGDDYYYVDNTLDKVVERVDEGIDTVFVEELDHYRLGDNVENLISCGCTDFKGLGNALDNSIKGGGGDDTLHGLAGDDTLDGAGGMDRMFGGVGDDTYYVYDPGAEVIELFDEGIDTVIAELPSYRLGANVENLETCGCGPFIGIGNELDNVITGGDYDDRLHGLAGNDTLDGGSGYDRLMGGLGDDTYYVDGTARVVELFDQGIDTVITTLGTYRLGANVENVTFQGTGAFKAVGNELDNVFVGGSGRNLVSYETAGSGVTADLGIAGPQDTRGAGIDTLVDIDNLQGSSFADTLSGNDEDNRLVGNGGNDVLLGGGGRDYFIFNTPLVAGEVASILDFTSGTDKFTLSSSVFSTIAPGRLAPDAFVIGSGPADDNTRIIYNPVTGAVIYDPDGTGGQAATTFAAVTPGLPMTANDFRVA